MLLKSIDLPLARRYQLNQYLPPYHRLQPWDPLEDGNNWKQLVEFKAVDQALRALRKVSLRRCPGQSNYGSNITPSPPQLLGKLDVWKIGFNVIGVFAS